MIGSWIGCGFLAKDVVKEVTREWMEPPSETEKPPVGGSRLLKNPSPLEIFPQGLKPDFLSFKATARLRALVTKLRKIEFQTREKPGLKPGLIPGFHQGPEGPCSLRVCLGALSECLGPELRGAEGRQESRPEGRLSCLLPLRISERGRSLGFRGRRWPERFCRRSSCGPRDCDRRRR